MKKKNIWQKQVSTGAGAVVIALFSAFAIVIVAGILVKNNWEYMVSQGYINLPPQKIHKTPNADPSPVLPRTNLGDWKIYENSQYGFSLAHPPEAEVARHMLGNGNSVDGFLIHDGAELEQSVWIYKTDCSEDCFQKEIVEWWPKTRLNGKEVAVSGIKAYEIFFDEGDGKVRREVYFRGNNDTVVYFVFSDLDSQKDKLPQDQEKMLNSFRF